MGGCGGDVHVIEVNRHFHICFIPLCILGTTNIVQCQRCNTTITLAAHMMGTCVRAKQPNIPIAKGKLVYLPVATAVSVEMGVHDESMSILNELEEGDAETPSVLGRKKNHEDETTGSRQQAQLLSKG
jgi:hypothetical protein